MSPSALMTFTWTMPTSLRLEKDLSAPCRGEDSQYFIALRSFPVRTRPSASKGAAHVARQNLPALQRVVEWREREVGDGHVGGGGQRDQQHQEAPGLLQGKVQVVGPLLGQRGQVQLAAGG